MPLQRVWKNIRLGQTTPLWVAAMVWIEAGDPVAEWRSADAYAAGRKPVRYFNKWRKLQ